MDLWIRSQDRENLIRVENLCYFNTCNEMESVGKNYILNKSWIGDKDCIILGEYKTRERALEVLDEIQKYIADSFKENEISQFLGTTGKSKIVYEMPQE